jgi:hypothetical protein
MYQSLPSTRSDDATVARRNERPEYGDQGDTLSSDTATDLTPEAAETAGATRPRHHLPSPSIIYPTDAVVNAIAKYEHHPSTQAYSKQAHTLTDKLTHIATHTHTSITRASTFVICNVQPVVLFVILVKCYNCQWPRETSRGQSTIAIGMQFIKLGDPLSSYGLVGGTLSIALSMALTVTLLVMIVIYRHNIMVVVEWKK